MSSDNNRYENYIAQWKADRKAKKLRQVQDLSLREVNEVIAGIERIIGCAIPEHVVILPELTPAEHATMLTQVMQQAEAVFNG